MINFEEIKKFRSFYFSGIAGTGMKPLAKFFSASGYTVAGADLNTEFFPELKEYGIKVYDTHDGKRLKNFDALVVSSSIKGDNPEMKYAVKNGVPIIRRSELLGYVFTLFNKSISISGTHGKTTATAMLGTIMKRFSSATAFVGGDTIEYSDYYSDRLYNTCIAETCEYNRNFYDVKPTVAVILNVCYDHVDTYKNLTEVIKAFRTFSKNSITVKNADDPGSESIPAYLTFGIKNDADFTAKNIKSTENGLKFTVLHKNKKYKAFVPVLGKHHVYNALAAIAAAYITGVPVECSVSALEKFRGVMRRAEKIGTINGAAVYSDYAHHPDEIEKTAKAFLSLKKGKTLVVFQPHTYSRTAALKSDFIRVLKPIKKLVLFRTYAAREDVKYIGSAKDLFISLGKTDSTYYDNVEDLIKSFKGYDNVLVLGAGDLDRHLRTVIKNKITTI